MLRVFATGLAANGLFVISGLAKQYVVAGSLAVADFGAYGALVAVASLLLVLVPFPAYLDIMIRGFSAAPDAYGTRKRLVIAARTELLFLVLVAVALAAVLVAYAAVVEPPSRRIWPLLLLLLVQYSAACVDLLLRMQQAHAKLAAFMAVRNLPAVAMLLVVGATTPLQVAAVEFASAALVALVFLRSRELRVRRILKLRWPWRRLQAEQLTLWLARLAQFGNSSMLRLAVPLVYGAHDTGLFFFALIAQLPCSLFLSVTTQIFGHTLARVQRGDWRTYLRTQTWFALPNVGYVVIMALLLPLWADAMSFVPKLTKYADAGPLVLAVVVYSAVLASDGQEYLLRARGLSRVLLVFSATSGLLQLAAVALAWRSSMSLVQTVYLCAAVQAVTLAAFSTYSARLVLGRPQPEHAP